MSRGRRLPILGPLVWVLLLVSGMGMSASVSQAGCGRSMSSKMHADGGVVIGFEQLRALGAPMNLSTHSAFPRWPSSPCAGLQCSQERPFPVPTLQAGPRIDPWAGLELREFCLPTPSSPLAFEDDCLPSTDRADRLARPPRPSLVPRDRI